MAGSEIAGHQRQAGEWQGPNGRVENGRGEDSRAPKAAMRMSGLRVAGPEGDLYAVVNK